MTGDSHPASIGRYRIDGVLGRGAMGVIYRAHDPEIDRPVAIKLIRADLLDGQERAEYILRFRREAQAAGRCSHPNIVAVYDFALHEGNPFLAMEFVDGTTLDRLWPAGQAVPPGQAVPVALQLLHALEAAHRLGVVHRDIKPANIMLVRGAMVKVADFGISRLESSAMTGVGTVLGTPSYMSPEQCRGSEVDGRSDLFSAAVVLYELLAGERPFPGRTQHEVWTRLLTQEPPSLHARQPAVPPALSAAVHRGLAKLPEDRFATAAEMAAAVAAALATPGAGLDNTVLMPPAPAIPAGSGLDPGDPAVATLQRHLAQYVGPIARLLVQSAIRTSGSIEDVCAVLATSIEKPADRHRFNLEMQGLLTGGTLLGRTSLGPTSLGSVPQAEQDRAQQELVRYLGPVARVLVRRTAANAASPAALWTSLATHIDDVAARKAFLAKTPPA